ncbi:hypothetical protein [Streptomyces violens]|uniref:hypothetical protein n=1 Tax=Streptomyces violens TaxID=66377 RepID=UPI0004BF459A|nr:hypothetical protein [Streptomyces violens]
MTARLAEQGLEAASGSIYPALAAALNFQTVAFRPVCLLVLFLFVLGVALVRLRVVVHTPDTPDTVDTPDIAAATVSA